MFKITDGSIHFTLTERQCVDLELRLNVTTKAKLWSHIGDYLFEYGTGKSNKDTLKVSSEEYTFLCKLLAAKTWEDCLEL